MKNIVKFVIPLILVIAIPVVLFLQKKENDIQKFDRITQKVFDEFHPTGISVAIVKDGMVVYEKSLGYKNADNVDFLDHNDIFNIASCSKSFTAAGIGKLVHEGLISWDDRVIDYLPNFKLADEYISKNLKIKDILSHRTGLGTFYGDLLWYNTDYTNDDIIERMQYLPLTKDFRSDFGYQNNMFTIAGEIIEKITGQSWERFIQKNFFNPLEMSDSRTSSDRFDGTEDIAFPHYNDSVMAVHYFLAGKPAISLWSSTRDLVNWTSMFLNDGEYKNEQILSPEVIKTLTSAHTILPVSEEKENMGIHFKNYGLGWYLHDYNGLKIINHDGSMPGFISLVAMVPEENLSVIILNNGFDFYCNDALFYSIIDIVTENYTNNWVEYYSDKQTQLDIYMKEFNEKRISNKQSDTKPSLAIEKYAGMYNDKMYGNAEIKFENNSLHLTLIPTKKIFASKMEHWENDVFKVIFKDVYLPFGLVKFEISNTGKVEGFKIDLPSSDFHFHNLDFRKIK